MIISRRCGAAWPARQWIAPVVAAVERAMTALHCARPRLRAMESAMTLETGLAR